MALDSMSVLQTHTLIIPMNLSKTIVFSMTKEHLQVVRTIVTLRVKKHLVCTLLNNPVRIVPKEKKKELRPVSAASLVNLLFPLLPLLPLLHLHVIRAKTENIPTPLEQLLVCTVHQGK